MNKMKISKEIQKEFFFKKQKSGAEKYNNLNFKTH